MVDDSIKDKVRPIYAELQGSLSQTPIPKNQYELIQESYIWESHNDRVNRLSKITGEDYHSFIIQPEPDEMMGGFIRVRTYRHQLGGLIQRLHAEYFINETAPFSGSPAMVMTQTQQQSQTQLLQMVLDFQSNIDTALQNCEEGSKEKSFLETLKSKLATVSNVNELFRMCLKLARESGLTIQDLMGMFT